MTAQQLLSPINLMQWQRTCVAFRFRRQCKAFYDVLWKLILKQIPHSDLANCFTKQCWKWIQVCNFRAWVLFLSLFSFWTNCRPIAGYFQEMNSELGTKKAAQPQQAARQGIHLVAAADLDVAWFCRTKDSHTSVEQEMPKVSSLRVFSVVVLFLLLTLKWCTL